jgi:hypothetical protein
MSDSAIEGFGRSDPLATNIAPNGRSDLGGLGSALVLRVAHAVVGVLYAVAFRLVYDTYISPIFGYSGLRDRQSSLGELIFSWSCIGLVSAALPLRIDRPSGVFAWMLYAFVYVPTLCMTFIIGLNPPEFYIPSLIALTLAIVAVGWTSQLPLPVVAPHSDRPLTTLWRVFLILLVILSAILWLKFRAIMNFSGINNIYYQRYAASQISNGIFGYIRTYYNFVVGVGLIAIGLSTRRPTSFALGILSFFFSYMIDAQKVSLIIPAWCIVIYAMQAFTPNMSILYTGGLTLMVFVSSVVGRSTSIFRFILDLIIVRSIAVPGQAFQLYSDFFEKMGHTWWSNVKGINLIVPPPRAYASDSSWPSLGLLIGREYFGINSRMNANANLFAGEGEAAAGAFGVLVIGVLLAIWLRYLDRAAVGWDRAFVLVISAPMALSLTNGHLSTILLSFGGLFWLVYLGGAKSKAPVLSQN